MIRRCMYTRNYFTRSLWEFDLSISLSIYLSMELSTYLPIYLSIYLSTYTYIYILIKHSVIKHGLLEDPITTGRIHLIRSYHEWDITPLRLHWLHFIL